MFKINFNPNKKNLVKKSARSIQSRFSRFLIQASQKVSGMGLLGTKAGMTTWFMPCGDAIPCTVIALDEGNIITQVKNERNGYGAVQIGYKLVKKKKITKSELGHLMKTNAPALRQLVEYRIANFKEIKVGQKIPVSSLFSEGDLVDVAGTSIGKGFQGDVKRW